MIEYSNIAHGYAKYRRIDRAAVEKLIVASGISSASRVLEIGCGTGNYIAEIQKRIGCECSGVDPSPEMIAQARQGNARIAYSIGPAEQLGLPEGAFHFAFSVDVIHHVADRAAYFREASRVLSVDGLLATLTDSEDTIRRRMPLAFYFPATIEPELRRYPTPAELRHHSEQARLEVVGEEIIETRYELTNLEAFRRKMFSCLRLISEEAFAAGMARMTRDLEGGAISCVSRNFVIWNRKRTAQSLRPSVA
jgi:ubiquinone/menaquinone biosynthesis C-methylase UbiE